MTAISNVPQLVDNKGGIYSVVAARLELGKFNKWKKRMLCYLTGMEPYYIYCIKDGPFKPKIAEGADKPDFEGPSDTKENMIIDLKLEYQTFRAKPSESLSQTYTRYKALLNELTNDGVTLSKHKINEEVSDDEEMTQVKVLIALPDDGLFVGKNHACNGEWIDITMKKVERHNPNNKLPNFNTGRLLVPESQNVNECLQLTKAHTDPESSKESGSEPQTPLLLLKSLQGASPSSEVMTLTYHDHSPKERPGLDVMKHTKPETQEYSNKSVSGPLTIYDTELVTSSVLTKVKINDQETKIDELNKLVQMLMDEKINSTQKIQESKFVDLQPESSKLVNSSKLNKDSKPNGKNTDSTKPVRPKPLQKPKLKCKLYHYTNHSTDDCYRILYYMKCKKEDHRTSNHDMYVASLNSSKTTRHNLIRHNRVIHVREGVLAESSQSSEASIGVNCTTYGSNVHSTTDHNDFEHFKRGPKVVFGDNSSCIAERHGSINCGGIVFSKVAFINALKYNLISISQLCDAKYIIQFDDRQGIIFNANKEIVLIALTRNDVYVLDMSSLTLNGACVFAKALESVKWLWHKRLSHLNFKNINKLAKQNKVLGLSSLVYSQDKPCSTCEKGKHKRASFKTKQNFSITKCLHVFHIDLFGPVSPISINHEKYSLVIIDEYSRYTWVYFLKKKSHAAEDNVFYQDG
ncbi:retrovirus-related pol polyprotein from transposon TNT 1-94 [Tanacetum coccineum]